MGMRSGIEFEVLTEATLQGTLDTDGKPLSLAEQDMIAIKATMRLGYLVIKDNAFAALKLAAPSLGELTVTSEEGSAAGKSKIAVTPDAISPNRFVYKTAASTAPAVTYDQDLSSGWTDLPANGEITAATGHKLTVAELTLENKARKAGNADVTSKA